MKEGIYVQIISSDNMCDRLKYLSDIFDYLYNISTSIKSIKQWNFRRVTKTLAATQINYLMLEETISSESYKIMIRESLSIDAYKLRWDTDDQVTSIILEESYNDIKQLMYTQKDIDKIRDRLNNDQLYLSLIKIKNEIMDQVYMILNAYMIKMNMVH